MCDNKSGFEASGRTIEEMAVQAPEVLDKLKALLREGRIEAVGSPYTHCMLGNMPPRMGLVSLNHGLNLLFRADCMANPLLWYLMGATEGMRQTPVSLGEITRMLRVWRQLLQEPFTGKTADYIYLWNRTCGIVPKKKLANLTFCVTMMETIE